LRLKILKKLKTASLNSEFTGSYKKKFSLKVLSLSDVLEGLGKYPRSAAFCPVDWKKWGGDQGCYLFAHIVEGFLRS